MMCVHVSVNGLFCICVYLWSAFPLYVLYIHTVCKNLERFFEKIFFFTNLCIGNIWVHTYPLTLPLLSVMCGHLLESRAVLEVPFVRLTILELDGLMSVFNLRTICDAFTA